MCPTNCARAAVAPKPPHSIATAHTTRPHRRIRFVTLDCGSPAAAFSKFSESSPVQREPRSRRHNLNSCINSILKPSELYSPHHKIARRKPRHAGTADAFGRDAKMFYIVPLTDMLLFAMFVYSGFRARSDSPAHKRFLYLATTALLVAAIARLRMAFSARNNRVDGLLSDLFLLALIAYDLWSTRKIHRVTLWAGLVLVVIQQIRIPLGQTAAWHSFANWVIAHAH